MDFKFLNTLSLTDLENLKESLLLGNEDKIEVLKEIEKIILYKKDVNLGIINYSSDRMTYYKKENADQCIELLSEIELNDLDFFANSLNARVVNRHPFFIERFGITSSNVTLNTFEDIFKYPNNIYSHEGVYNTYNYIKDYIYYLLMNNPNVTKEDIFSKFKDKYNLVAKKIPEIASYLYTLKQQTDNSVLSIGNKGLGTATKRIESERPLTEYQQNIVGAVEFGTTIEKLEDSNYDDCKRLLFTPRKK